MVNYQVCTIRALINEYFYSINYLVNKVPYKVRMEGVYATTLYRRKKDWVENRWLGSCNALETVLSYCTTGTSCLSANATFCNEGTGYTEKSLKGIKCNCVHLSGDHCVDGFLDCVAPYPLMIRIRKKINKILLDLQFLPWVKKIAKK